MPNCYNGFKMKTETKMKIKCVTCNKNFLKESVFENHSCVKALEDMSLEELLKKYNEKKALAK